MTAKQRPVPRKSALTGGAAAVLRPTPATTPGHTAGSAARASVASTTGKAGSDGDSGERIIKVTARVGEDLAGRCRAAYIDGLLRGGPVSFEAWIADAMREKLACAEQERGGAYEPLPSDRIPKGHR